MLRRAPFTLVVATAAAFLVADPPPRAAAADPAVAGNWVLTYSPRGGMDQALAVIKVAAKDGAPTASVLSSPLRGLNLEVSKFRVDGTTIRFDTSIGWTFEGTLAKDGKTAVGSFGSEQAVNRAKLTRTEKDEVAADEAMTRATAPAPWTEAQKLMAGVPPLRQRAAREKDAEKKKELTEKADAAQKEADEKVPALLREVVAKHAESAFALDAAADLLRGGKKYGVTADEAAKLLAGIEKQAAAFGPRFATFQTMAVVESLAGQKGLEAAVDGAAARLAETPGAAAEFKSRALTARKAALEGLGKTAEAKALAGKIAALETQIDKEYLAKVPPFEPAAYAGRKEKGANRVAVMELFTGAQCPPCVAADVAFDALQKAYKPTDLVLIQYHMHIPGPDPLTNPASVARWDYYREAFPEGVRGTPTTVFNGKPQAGGGGGMANAESKYKQYTGIIDPLLKDHTDVEVTGKANRTGDRLEISVGVGGAEGDDLKLRLLVVEETVKYVGGNRLRFHHHVVRAMPGGAGGVAIKDKAFKHTVTADLAGVRGDLTKYLDDYAANTRPFPKPDRPMDMKAVRVIALVQNDKTREILQAAEIEIGDHARGASR